MKVYTRVSGDLKGELFREGNGCHAEILIYGKWREMLWSNHELKDLQYFRLVGNNFKLK